jgi:hypothetical protein
MKTAYAKIADGKAAGPYNEDVARYATKLVGRLQEAESMHGAGSPDAVRGPLSSQAMLAVVRGICPCWPFCT